MDFSLEQIYSGLFNVLQTQAARSNPNATDSIVQAGLTPLPVVALPRFNFADRRFAPLATLQSTQYPALMLLEKGEIYTRSMVHGPPMVQLIAHVIIQTFNQDPTAIPSIQVNNLTDIVRNLVETGAANYLSGGDLLAKEPDIIGGLVFECIVSGREMMYGAIKELVYAECDMEVTIIATH